MLSYLDQSQTKIKQNKQSQITCDTQLKTALFQKRLSERGLEAKDVKYVL